MGLAPGTVSRRTPAPGRVGVGRLISTKAPQVVGLPLFQGTPLREASLWAKVFHRKVAERARLPQGTAMQGGRCAKADSPRSFRDNQEEPLCAGAMECGGLPPLWGGGGLA